MLRLSDGTELEGASLIAQETALFLYMPGITLKRAFNLLINPEATARITFVDGPVTNDYAGYTRLTSVTDEGGMVTATLRKGAA